jgi:hypothetical protein
MVSLIGVAGLVVVALGLALGWLRQSNSDRVETVKEERARRWRAAAFRRWIAPSNDKAVERLRGTPQPR